MSPHWVPLKRLHPARHQDAVKLRLLRSYDRKTRTTTPSTIYAHEAIFQDEQGNRIHACCEKHLIPYFKPLLKEGQVHGIENPIVSKNTQNLTDHLYKLSFVKDTVITNVNDEDFPDIMFKFENFKALSAAKDIQYRPMFDVIGLLHVDQPPTERIGKSGTKVRVMDIWLEDLDGEKISCTLWSSYVDQLLDYLNQQPLHPTVAIMQFCQGAVYNDMNKASTFYDVTKLILDQDFLPILEFKKHLKAKGVKPQNVLSFSASTSKSEPSSIEIKTLQQITENYEGRAWILCKVIGFEQHGAWCYTSCKKCSKKLSPTNGIYTCGTCHLTGFVMRYRVKVRVVDNTDNLALTLFGKQAEDFLRDTGDDSQIPNVFKSIIDQPLMLELDVKKTESTFSEKTYSVQQIITDQNILGRYIVDTSSTQDSVNSKPNKAITQTIDLVATEESTKNDDPQKHGSDVTYTCLSANMKRDLTKEFEDMQTHLSKKPKVSVKIEKD
ncbi:hypothetical protein DM860_001444 [Cuscuta australis]|uniref:Replication factor A C-terminal domain-containing protein n=1 Tax=Cuscuta australis TaxID=267555 RepID=A0A328EAD8_9ASTE|nr:hypothetical protein DM860_001444 [Cuscuta australis]